MNTPPKENIPKHIAIIMDGNGRWAKRRLQPRFMGHRAGVKTVADIVKRCAELGVEVLSLFAFSSENWRRPGKEVSLLMELFSHALDNQVKKLHDNNIRLCIIGDIDKFTPTLQQKIAQAQELTRNNTGLIVNIAANYGGRWDITQSVRQIAQKVATGELKPEDINEEDISALLTTSALPEPDLFIRTGGEQRVSNFLLWQMAYTEFFFTDVLWPEFDSKQLDAAISSFSKRERRFGRTSEQLQGQSDA
ncbi:undecaprenyl pyrophosphate synthase [Methylophaga aminisulfidivorans MP]|uniref:Ditrans,polycis-undecaprenyl-diphosphate synthase ((2E,6E)-farnesyl-diphosphate specific) n=3 Tax=Methylophaga TaxID=40222 RepID=F5SUU2_9GAMM|nr:MULTISPECIES: isoprenyl transferase [Methylophaga]EGL56025.1 undecaprenyl pyrophosphate synthase [Methylophaga aminisulfidivorans MP]GLP98294.1 ditrans,polycis-undecaprenyl-diphosphate synthase [Methylophaga thalassica]